MDPFENQKQEIYQPPAQDHQFPDFNTKWLPQFEEGIKTKTGKNLDKGSDILKKSCNFYMYCLGLIALIMFFPTIVRFLYELSSWAYEGTINLFD
jgi:hypothetical protein